MRDPVQTPSGTCYDRESLTSYLAGGEQKDPVTFKPLTAGELVPNKALRRCIEDFIRRNPWTFEFFETPAEDYLALEFSLGTNGK